MARFYAWTSYLLLSAVLPAACGGGSGGGPIGSPPPPRDIDFGYWWTVDDRQIADTAPHVSFVHVHDGGNWDDPNERLGIIQRQIEEMQQARARGMERVYLSVGFLTFTVARKYRGVADLTAYKQQLDALDLSRMVVVLMPLDEPDVSGVDDATMTVALNAIRAAWGPGPKLLVSYGDHWTGKPPGIDAADIIVHDAYELGADVLKHLPPIRADQSYGLIVGGADPWRTDPQAFVDYALAHGNVALVWAFMYGARADATQQYAGIETNGMLPIYTAAGCNLTHKCSSSTASQ